MSVCVCVYGVQGCMLQRDVHMCAHKLDHRVIEDGGGGLRAQMLCVMTARAALNDEMNISKRDDKDASEAMKGIIIGVDARDAEDPC